MWYPHVYNRRHQAELKSLPSKREKVGRLRRAVAAEIGMHKVEVKKTLKTWAADHQGHIKYREVPTIMLHLNGDIPATPENIHFVMACGDQHGLDEDVDVDVLTDALAVWRCMRQQEGELDRQFVKFDENKSGVLERNQVKELLKELNDGIPVSWQETDWVIEAADFDGRGALNQRELRAAIAWWYLNVDVAAVEAVTGLRSTIPYFYSVFVATFAAVMVRTVSAEWSDDRTQAWFDSSLGGVLFKLCILDPIKVMCCCEVLVGPLFAVLTGELSFEGDLDMDMGVEIIEDGLEARIEEYTGSSGNSLDALGGIEATNAARQAGALQTHTAVMAVGGLGAAKFARKLEQKRVRREVDRQLEAVCREDLAVQAKHQHSMARSSSLYAEKVRKKREGAGKMGAGAFDAHAKEAMIKADKLHKASHQKDMASVSNFLEAAKDGKGGSVHYEDQLWKQAIDENLAEKSRVEQKRSSSRKSLQEKIAAKKKVKRQGEVRMATIKTLRGVGAMQTFSRALPQVPQRRPALAPQPPTNQRSPGSVPPRPHVRVLPVLPVESRKEDEGRSPARPTYGLGAVTSGRIKIPTFNMPTSEEMTDEAELDAIIAASAHHAAGGELDDDDLDAILRGAGP